MILTNILFQTIDLSGVLQAVGIGGFIVFVLGSLIFIYGRQNAAERALRAEMIAERTRYSLQIAKAREDSAAETRRELDELHNKVLEDNRAREKRLNEEIAALREENARRMGELLSLTQRLNEAEDRFEDLQTLLAVRDGTINSLMEERDNLQTANGKLLKENGDLQRRVGDLEQIMTGVQQQVHELVDERNSLREKLEALQLDNASLQAQLTAIGHPKPDPDPEPPGTEPDSAPPPAPDERTEADGAKNGAVVPFEEPDTLPKTGTEG